MKHDELLSAGVDEERPKQLGRYAGIVDDHACSLPSQALGAASNYIGFG
ncbi:hypothetical protein RCO27_05530 [Sphingosinicella sp. LHD-64]|nr:hypothetical protein [Sphingosinicella sp. LHD-64]MDQ8755684.1 hypothetical protein [Sphingosinicella sp. LHD-64]